MVNRRDTAEASLFRWRGCVAGWKWILTFILRVPSYVAVLCMYSVLALLVPSVSLVNDKYVERMKERKEIATYLAKIYVHFTVASFFFQ